MVLSKEPLLASPHSVGTSDSEPESAYDSAELVPDGYDARLWNDDLGPLLIRTFSAYSIFAFWMSDVHSVAGYITSGTLFTLGISCWQVLLAHMIGICVVMLLCNFVSRPSVVTGCPFPVISRMSFGVYGANIPACIRGIQSIPYYGINTWMASNSLLVPILKLMPWLKPYADDSGQYSFLDLSYVGWGAFVFMWLTQACLFILGGIDAIRKFIDLAGPAVYVTMVILTVYLCYEAGEVSFSIEPEYMKETKEGFQSAMTTVEATAIIVSFFAGPMLNFGDITRYAISHRAVMKGNFWGCPVNFLFFALLVVISVAATPKVFGELIMDPVKIVAKIDSFLSSVVGALTFSIATMGINVAANFLPACFDFSNVAPKYVSMQMGGLIAAVGSILCMPWKLYNRPEIIQCTLGVLGSFMGPLMGINLAEYYVIRKRYIIVDDLFSTSPTGTYWYKGGCNMTAICCLIPSITAPLLCVLVEQLACLKQYAYFVGTISAFLLYSICSLWKRRRNSAVNREESADSVRG